MRPNGTELISKKQISLIKTIFAKSGKMAYSAEIANDYSNGRTGHISELNQAEAKALIDSLIQAPSRQGNASERMRKKIISLAHQMGWQVAGKADMERIDNWCKKYGYLGKGLNAYKYNELPRLVRQMETVFETYLKAR